ncbi:hypothetical protein [Sporolactobacillus spathodeae]|uniref:Quercetin dioxygenase-like cupin family protein n=1 Tax=Sporolactobacillus spathodeae TaxID=1465502 RepID=A0ABS2Q8K7_9BACL|nr:hypothetical protein [Sporolactobacillus spathodeae]MBM7658120.1 quercetin dioxygenase-like cupin family protein [Sporolactobacillus spathodeae]
MDVLTFQPTDTMKEKLYQDSAQTIVHLSLKAGQKIPEHHGADAIVTVIPVRGEVIFSTREQSVTLSPGKLVRLNAQELHALEATQNSDIIVVKWKKE